MAKLRLVAYRKATSTDSLETTYELDLQENPNISLNYKFSDVKNPETRQSSYSQTFKLPFSDNNNEFFQNWYNVNLETLVFSTRQKFNATIFVGTIPQFEGILQLKSVYQKAQLYEVVVLSNVADLFTVIGNKRLKDVFKNVAADGDVTYSAELNHTFTKANVVYSWDGSSTSFQNTGGTSLRDATAGVQKVMYPMSLTVPDFYYNPTATTIDGTSINTFLSMSQSDINSIGYSVASSYDVPITQLRPAVQIKELLKLIIARAGFTYTSSFIDGSYFGKLFMTTCNFSTSKGAITTVPSEALSGYMNVGNDAQWGDLSVGASESINCNDTYGEFLIPANTVTPTTNNTTPADVNNLWNEANHYFTKSSPGQTVINIRFRLLLDNVTTCDNYPSIPIAVRAKYYDLVNSVQTQEMLTNAFAIYSLYPMDSTSGFAPQVNLDIDISNLDIGEAVYFTAETFGFQKADVSAAMTFVLGGYNNLPNDCYSQIKCDYDWWDAQYNNIIDIPSCIDEKITQNAFLKDIIERFNLVITTDPEDQYNIIIEPFNDYIGSGDIKYWTDKLDVSKEVIVKDTTQLQKKTVLLSDLEDNDLWNKAIKEETPDLNVYGKIEITETNNDFANGEMKNNPIFSPYINEKVFVNNDSQLPTALPNMAVQYEWTSKPIDGGYENVLEATKPKLFYYSGSATPVKDIDGASVTYYLHWFNTGVSPIVLTAESFTTYPLCSPFDLDASSSGSATIAPTTKSLYWNQAPPIAGNLNVFNYESDSIELTNSLYYTYWQNYLNEIYSPDSRIMECYINLNEVDIFNFTFADDIFIKDSYWRILEISNYQVGGDVSTKVTLIKSNEELNLGFDVNYVLGNILGSNTLGPFFLWCPADNPGCTPSLSAPNYLGLFADITSCEAQGGTSLTNSTTQSADGLYLCLANTGSPPINRASVFSFKSILSNSQAKTIISDRIAGLNKPFITGSYTNKFTQSLMPSVSDDIVIKYNTMAKREPKLDGESHRVILSGNTSGNTKGYAYVNGKSRGQQLRMPDNVNMIIRVKGVVTVIGGTSATYPLGTTEAFAYYTAFKNVNGTTTQLSTPGGQQEFSIREGANPTTCTLDIDVNNGILRFGLEDSQTDTKRIWQMSVDLDVNRVYNMSLGYDENWALYQNGQNIQLQNSDYLIWN